MSKYNTFLTLFIIAVLAFIFFLVFYLQAIFGFVFSMAELNTEDPSPFLLFNKIFTPGVIISGVLLAFSSLVYRILGIVHVVRNKAAGDGEKALWIVGFILMGFVTAIVFLVLAKGRKFVD